MYCFTRACWLLLAFIAAAPEPGNATPPARVVSINLCTDLIAMRIAAPGQLHSVSHLAHDPDISPATALAANYPSNNGAAEQVLKFDPELVLAGTFTTRETVALLRRLNYRVETFPIANSFADIRNHMRRMGDLLGQDERAADEIQLFDKVMTAARELAGIRNDKAVAVSYGPNGFTNGANTLGNEIIAAAGYVNLADQLGYSNYVQMPLEQLILHAPDLVLTGGPPPHPSRSHELLDHPALDGAGFARLAHTEQNWICGGYYTALAVRELADFQLPK